MDWSRRRFLQGVATVAGTSSIPRRAFGQRYPARPVRLIVGLAPGGIQDLTARLIAQWLAQRFGQPFVVENRVGAGTNLAAEAVIRASPDGYTLLLVGAPNAINATLYEKLNFDFMRDIAPVAGISREPQLMLIHSELPTATLGEFIGYAKANPGKLNLASAGVGTLPHLSGELFKAMAGVDLLHVPYRGGAAALSDLIGGQVHVMFSATSAAFEYQRTGKLRTIAVTTAARLAVLPAIPTVSEFVPGYESTAFIGMGAPRDTPTEIVASLNAEVNAALVDPKIMARFAVMGGTPLPGSPAEFGRLIAGETDKWGRVIKRTGIKAA